MTPKDQRAIRAASQAVSTATWILDHPHEPVPVSIIRPAMVSFSAFVLDQLIDGLQDAANMLHEDPKEDQREPPQPDELPATGS